MTPYQPYFPMMNNSGYMQPMQNTYADRISQMQQYQQQLQQPVLTTLGKIVENEDVVRTMDIPMDGNMYYFPKADGTEVYAKQWLANGKTHTITFKPVLEQPTNNSMADNEKLNLGAFTELVQGIKDDILTLNDKIDRISRPAKAKKESLDE